MSAAAVIRTALGEAGQTEDPPRSNRTKYGAAYGLDGQPWCVMFLWWCFRAAGEEAAFGGKTASCGALLRSFRARGQTVAADALLPGDIVILCFSGTGDTEHCGLVTEVLPDGRFRTVEGNTSPGLAGSQDNGGCVAVRTRVPGQVVGACRPLYRPEDDCVGHWAEAALEWGRRLGLISGYADGTLRPDRAVTRAELMTVLRRYDGLRHAETQGGTET